jgi:death-on-curing protein
MVCPYFLGFNGVKVAAPPAEKYLTFLHLADGSLSEEELSAWLTAHTVPL